jgi:hypothetical protein
MRFQVTTPVVYFVCPYFYFYNTSMYLCVRRESILPLSKILIFDLGIVPAVWYFIFISFHLIGILPLFIGSVYVLYII